MMRSRSVIATATAAALAFMLLAVPVFAAGPSGPASGSGELAQTQTQAQQGTPGNAEPVECPGDGEPDRTREQTTEQVRDAAGSQDGECSSGEPVMDRTCERTREQVRIGALEDPAGVAARTRATNRVEGSAEASGTSAVDTTTVAVRRSTVETGGLAPHEPPQSVRNTWMHRIVSALPEGLTSWFRAMLGFFVALGE